MTLFYLSSQHFVFSLFTIFISIALLVQFSNAQILERFYSQKVPIEVQNHFQLFLDAYPDKSSLQTLWHQSFSQFTLAELLSSKSQKGLSGNELTDPFQDLQVDFLADVTDPLCRSHMSQLFLQAILALVNPSSTWALQMIDAWGKIPDGILSGHTSSLGDFAECLQIRGNHTNQNGEFSSFKGRYCLAYVLPASVAEEAAGAFGRDMQTRVSASPAGLIEAMGSSFLAFLLLPQFGTCFPSSCSKEDAQQILTNANEILNNNTIVHWITSCQTEDKPPFDTAAIIMIVILACIVSLCILGTLADVLLYQKAAPGSPMKGIGMKALVAFSVYTNTLKWLNTDTGKGVNLGCLHGLRFLSMAWVVLGHTWQAMGVNQFLWNTLDFMSIYNGSITLMAILNGTLSVDTFFVISGTLASYHIFRALDKSKGKINVLLLYLHRYLRLTPTYMLLVGVVATLLPYFGTGPSWATMENESQLCRKYWWHNLLYITNLIKYPPNTYSCYSESWYLSNDMQFFIAAPLIIIPIFWWKKIGLLILALFHVASVVAPTVIKATKHLPPTIILTIDQGTYSEDLYNPPWTRMGPYVIGITLGYILYLEGKSKTRRFPVLAFLSLWIVFTTIALAVVFGIQRYFNPLNVDETLESFGSDFYGGFNRYVWGAVVAWIIYACINGYGGWVNDFLCWKPFVPLGRLTFCVYMSSLHLQMFFHLTTLHPWHYSVYTTVNMFFAHLVMALLVGYVLTMTLESPFMQLEKLMFPETRAPRPPPTSTTPEHPEVNVEQKESDKQS